MKLKMFMDVAPGINLDAMWAYSKPGVKSAGRTRIAFTVDIPDHLVAEEDLVVDVSGVEVEGVPVVDTCPSRCKSCKNIAIAEGTEFMCRRNSRHLDNGAVNPVPPPAWCPARIRLVDTDIEGTP